MFTTKAKYNEALATAAAYQALFIERSHELNELTRQWNALVRRVNNGELVPKSSAQSGDFTRTEVETLIRLCHPDKHNGSKSANDITARLLALRNKLA